MTDPAISSRWRDRSPALVHGGILVALVIVLALQLVSAPRQSVPTIAEIAPHAVAQISEPPPEQATDLGKEADADAAAGLGPGGGDGEGEGPGADEDVTDDAQPGVDGPREPRQFRCVGDPPRQTEDPQSPKCVPFWDGGDNGGATAPGVTASEVRVVVPGASNVLLPALENHFNERFNFYGRRLRLIDTSAERNEALDDPIGGQERAAVSARTTHDAFASTDFWYSGGVYYMRRLADPRADGHRVIGVSYQSIIEEGDLAAAHPYLWQYPLATDRQLTMLGEWVCKQLVPGTASLSSDLVVRSRERVLGLVVMDDFRPPEYGQSGKVSMAPLENEMASCGGFADTYRIDLTNENPEQFGTAVSRMAAAGVTSVVCVCDSDPMLQLWDNATGSAYFPEWIAPSHTENEHVWIKRQGDDLHAQATMGLEFHPAFLEVHQDPWYWAASEGSPGFTWDALGNESSYSRQAFFHPQYRSLLVIAAGIQLAGPNLTPETFAQGLQATDAFPNPSVGLEAGKVGFAGDHSMTEDAAAYWFSTSEVGPFGPGGFQGQGAGTSCFLDGARRYRLGMWPATPAAVGQAPCFTGETLAYDGT